MEKDIASLRSGGRNLMLIAVLFVLVLPGSGNTAQLTKNQSIRQKVLMSMKIAKEQYNRRLYKVAEITLGKINEQHINYLSNAERKNLEAITKNIGVALAERGKISRILTASDHLAEQNQFAQAIERLEMIKNSKFLSKSESKQINNEIAYLQDKQSALESKKSGLIKQGSQQITAGQTPPTPPEERVEEILDEVAPAEP